MKLFSNKVSRFIDRGIAGTIGKQLFFFTFLSLAVFLILFTVSMLLYPPDVPVDVRFWGIVLNFLDFGGYDETYGAGRVLILITNIFGMVLFGGILVSVLTNIIVRRIDRVKEGDVYHKFSKHILIIGYDPICEGLVKQLAEKYDGEIVLQTTQEVPDVRHDLFTDLEESLIKKITIVSGSRTSLEDMKRLRVHEASEVFLLGEPGDDRDSHNIECMRIINALLEKQFGKIRCNVLFDRQTTFFAFQQQDMGEIREHIDFAPFNFCDSWAQKVFVDLQYSSGEVVYTPLDREPIKADSGKKVHLVILGMSNMGVALGLQAAQLCHFPNFFTKGIKTRVTFIDENAGREMLYLKGHLESFFAEIDYFYRDINGGERFNNTTEKEKFTDIEFEFIKARFEQKEVQDHLIELSAQEDTYLTIAVAIGDSPAALACGLYLPARVYDSGANILIRQEFSCAAIEMLSGGKPGDTYRKYKNVKPFGMLQDSFDMDRADNILPMMIKYTYDNTSNESIVRGFPEETIRKNWMENWRAGDNVSALKASNRYCANFCWIKQRSLDIKPGVELTDEQINFAARMEHNRWVAEKLLLGFRAPRPEEAAGIAADKKREYFKERFIHEDIKAYEVLGSDEKNIDVKIYDINISKALPYMIGEYEKGKKHAAK
jgi:hypothetical protein